MFNHLIVTNTDTERNNAEELDCDDTKTMLSKAQAIPGKNIPGKVLILVQTYVLHYIT